jgi:hypothetical protein
LVSGGGVEGINNVTYGKLVDGVIGLEEFVFVKEEVKHAGENIVVMSIR